MATKPDDEQQDDLELTDPIDPADGEDGDGDDDSRDRDPDPDADEQDEGDEEEVLTFGDDITEAKPDDSSVIKHLREQLREARKQAAASPQAQPETIEVGPEPEMGDDDVDYDEDKFKKKWTDWNARKEAAERQKGKATEAAQKQAEEWQGEIRRYNEAKASLGYSDVADAEETVVAALSEVQQAVLVKAADNPAKVMYALAKHPDKLAQLAGISDPLKLAAQIARLEGQLKVVKKRKAPDPEKIERGSGGTLSHRTDKQLEKLQKKADETGDRTELIRYKKKNGIS